MQQRSEQGARRDGEGRACVLVKEGGTPRSCETPWNMASMGKRESTRRSSPELAPFASGSGGVIKYRVLLQLSPSFRSCSATNSPSSGFSNSLKIAPAPSGTMNPSMRLRLLRSNRISRPCKAKKGLLSSSLNKEGDFLTLAQVQNVMSERLG